MPGWEVAGLAGKKKEETRKKTGKKAISLEQGQEKKPKAPKKAFKYPGRGAPKIYGSAEELAKGCEKYFAGISVVETMRNALGEPVKNSLGREVEQIRWLRQPTMGGLARSLGITDRTLRNYEENEELRPVVEWAKGVCREWLIEEVTTREKGSLNGLIFVLENNYGMRERSEVELRSQTIEEFLAGAGEQEF